MIKKLSIFFSLIFILMVNVNALIISDLTPNNSPYSFNSTNQLITISTDNRSICKIDTNFQSGIIMTTNDNLTHIYDYNFGNITLNNTNYNYNVSCFLDIPIVENVITPTNLASLQTINSNITCNDVYGGGGNECLLVQGVIASQVHANNTCKVLYGGSSNFVRGTLSGQSTSQCSFYPSVPGSTVFNNNCGYRSYWVSQWYTSMTCSNIGELQLTKINKVLTRKGINFNISITNPNQNHNFTFDQYQFNLNLTTSKNSICYYNFLNNETIFSNTNSTNHNTLITLPIANQNTQNLIYNIRCNLEGYNFTKILQVNKAQLPLSFDILVPVNNQIFNAQTSNIEFNINTNYQSNCFYKLSNQTNLTQFSNTGSSSHQTNYSINQNQLTYNMTFLCSGIIINTNVTRNLTFFLEELINTPKVVKANLTTVSSQLSNSGSNIGGMLSNLAPNLAEFIFNLAFILAFSGIIFSVVYLVRRLK